MLQAYGGCFWPRDDCNINLTKSLDTRPLNFLYVVSRRLIAEKYGPEKPEYGHFSSSFIFYLIFI